MPELAWPVTKCENPKCGFDLRERTPRAKDRALSEDGSGKPMWADFCPRCGRGYIVGERIIPIQRPIGQMTPLGKPLPPPTAKDFFDAKAEAEKPPEPEPEPEPEIVFVDEVKSIPTELIYVMPEDTKAKAVETQQETTTGSYFCTKCNLTHRANSKLGIAHVEFKKGV